MAIYSHYGVTTIEELCARHEPNFKVLKSLYHNL